VTAPAVPPGDAPLLLHVFPGFGIGGAQVRFAAIANRFGPRWRHGIVALNGQTGCTARLGPDVPHRLVAPPYARHDRLPRRILRIRALLRALRPAALVTSNWGSMDWAIANLAWPTGIRHLHTEDGFGPEEATAQLPRRVLTRRLVLRRATVVLPSRLLERIALQVWRLPPARLRCIPNGVDLARFAPRAGDRGEGPIVIGTVAALRPEKNLPRLLDAFARVAAARPARLVIVGDGPERPRLEALAAAAGLAAQVEFAGHIADPAALYRRLDIFALSSDTEQMPISVLEAMASGLPVAATDVGDVRAMLDPAQGGLVVPHDAAALAEALLRLAADPARRAALGAANRSRAEAAFDEATMFAAWRDLYDGAAAG
jgi:glycosyltransferase involved in cell wall biosynthesis